MRVSDRWSPALVRPPQLSLGGCQLAAGRQRLALGIKLLHWVREKGALQQAASVLLHLSVCGCALRYR